MFGELYPPTGAQPKFAQIYLYVPANIGDESRIDIRMNHMRLSPSMSAAEKRVLRELVTLYEENLSICIQYVKDVITCKNITEEDLGPEIRIIFHEDEVPSGDNNTGKIGTNINKS